MQRKNLLIINGLVICILMFTTVGQGSEPKWRPLAEQEKLSILTEITESLQKLKSVGVSFEWSDGKLNKNGTEEITGEYNYFIVFDDHRHYLKQGLKQISELDGATNSEESGFAPIVERSWNGTLMRSLDCRSSTGSIRGEVPYLTADEVMPFSIIGRDHSGQSWIKRYQNRDVTGIDYDVAIGAENESLIKVTERPKNLTSIYARQTFIFDRTKDFAITRCYLENVYQDDDKIHRLSDIRFEDFKQIDGVHIPFKISRIAESSTFDLTGVQCITVKEVTVNDKSHEKFLRDFTFPRNTNIYDYILGMPIHIGVDSDELENILEEGLQLAKKEIGQGVTNSIEHPYQGDTEKKLTENLIQSDFNENKGDPAIAKEQEDGVHIPYLISIVIILILAVVIGIVLKKRLNGHSAFIIICCFMLFGSNAFAEKTRNYQLYSPDLLDDLIPEHRAIYEKDLTRLCGINCLYQVYLWIDDQPKYRYRDLMKMVDYIDGVTIEEILDCAKQIGLEGHAKIVNYKYLLESAKSAKIALMTALGKKAHFITFFGTEDKTSTYYIDYPRGQRHISEDLMVSRLKLLVNARAVDVFTHEVVIAIVFGDHVAAVIQVAGAKAIDLLFATPAI